MPTKEQALAFCIMLGAGLPASEAILYFIDSDDPTEIALFLQKWQKSRTIRSAMSELMGRPWQELTLEERCRYALDHHYAALAYLLFSTHYAEVGAADKAKLDSARTAIEAKLAGTAGKGNEIEEFLKDIRSGRVKLGSKPIIIPEALKEPSN